MGRVARERVAAVSRYFTPHERSLILARFSSTLAMLVECNAYWCPSRRRILFRSVATNRKFAMPPDVVLVGRYAQSPAFKPKDFMGDLDALLAKLARNALLAPR